MTAAAAAAVLSAHRSLAASDAWSTAPASANFSGINWTTGATTGGAATGTITAGDALYFDGSTTTTLVNDEAANFNLSGFTFNSDASAYTITGTNAFNLSGGITNGGANLETFSGPFLMSAQRTFTTTAGGGNISVSGTITGAGGINVLGGGVVTLSGTASTLSAGLAASGTGATAATIPTINIVAGAAINTTSNSLLIANVGTAVSGVVNQTGGSFTTATNLIIGGGSTSVYGYYGVSGGTFTLTGTNRFRIGQSSNAAGADLLYVMGGTMSSTTAIALNDTTGTTAGTGGAAVIYVSSGSITDTSATTSLGIGGRAGQSSVTVGGTGTITLTAATSLGAGIAATSQAADAGRVGILNLGTGTAGGTLQTSAVNLGTVQSPLGYVNFNGGTLKAQTATTTFMAGLTQANIFPAGATINDNGVAITIAQPLLSPSGNGVSSISVSGATGFKGAPYVQISAPAAGGTPATAVANLDANGNVTSITVTSPGTGYTSAPTVNLVGGGGSAGTVGSAIAAQTGGGLNKTGTGILTLSGADTYTGSTTVSAGTLLVNGSLSGGGAVSVASGTSFGGSGSVAGSVTSAGTIVPGGAGTVGTLTLGGTTTLTGGTIGLDLNGSSGANTTAGANDLIAATNLTATGTILVNPTYSTAPTAGTTYTFATYSGTLSGGANLASAVRSSSVVDPSSTPGSLMITYTGATSANLTWKGNLGGAWDTVSTKNWLNGSTPDYFYAGDTVTFDDTGTATGVTIATTVVPASTTVSSSMNNYTFSGAGSIGGAGGLSKSGSSVLTVATSNSYTGTTAITGGTLSVAANTNLGAAAAPITLDTGGTLTTTNAAVFTDTHPITVNAGGGTLNINSTGSGGSGQFYIATANLLAGSGPLTLTGNGSVATTGAGNLRIGATNSYSGAITINSGGSFEFGVAGAVATGATFTVGNQGELITNSGVTFPNAITVAGGTSSILSFENGTAGVISGPITLNANAVIGLRDWYANATVRSGTISGVMSGTGGITTNPGTANTGNPYLYLTAANTYTGPTVIAANTTLELANLEGATGSLSPSSAITDNGTLQFQRTVASVQGTDFGAAPITGNGGIAVLAQANPVTVTLNAANTYLGGTVIGLGNFAASTVIATASGAMGSGTVSILGNGTANALQLAGGITLANPIILSAKTAANTGAGIESTAGPNTLSGTVTLTNGGNNYNVQSDAGSTLTFSNANGFNGAALTGSRVINFNGAGNTVVSGTIVNGTGGLALAVSQVGTGITTLAGSSSYSGVTTVSAGTLLVNGTITSVPTVAVGATLGGSGNISNGTTALVVNGTIAAGSDAATVGTLTTGAEAWNAGGAFTAKTSGAAVDQLSLSGLTIGGAFGINLVAPNGSSGVAVAPGTYVLATDTESSVSNPFATSTVPANLSLNVSSGVTVVGGGTFALVTSGTFDATTGGYDLDLSVVSAAPEPASLLLAGMAAAPLVLGRRRRRGT